MIDDAWYNVLTLIKERTPQEAILNSWWDFGDWFKVIGNRSPRIGGMWDIWITPTDKGISVTTGGQHEPQPVGPYEGPEVVQWEMRTVTALALKDARAAARKLMQGSELSTILAPVREAYAKAVGVQRAALLAAIVTEITQPYGGLPGKPARPAKAKAKRRK